MNTGTERLTFSGSYHYFGGYDYGPIIEKGFRQRVLRGEHGPVFVDDPRWEAARTVAPAIAR